MTAISGAGRDAESRIDSALHLLSRLLARVSSGRLRLFKYYFMAQPVSAPDERGLTGGRSLHVERMQATDPRIAQFPRPASEIARRFDAGAHCLAAWQRDTFAGFLWFTERRYDEDEVRSTFVIHPADLAVWDFDVYVEPRFRHGRTFGLLWHSALASMHALGAHWSISQVSAFNVESIRAHQRLGARSTGWAVFLLFGSFQLTVTSLGSLKCRWLEHGPYPTVDIHAPRATRLAANSSPAEPSSAGVAASGDQPPPQQDLRG